MTITVLNELICYILEHGLPLSDAAIITAENKDRETVYFSTIVGETRWNKYKPQVFMSEKSAMETLERSNKIYGQIDTDQGIHNAIATKLEDYKGYKHEAQPHSRILQT